MSVAFVSVSLGASEGPEVTSSCDVSLSVSESVVIAAPTATVAEIGVVKPSDFVASSTVSLSE